MHVIDLLDVGNESVELLRHAQRYGVQAFLPGVLSCEEEPREVGVGSWSTCAAGSRQVWTKLPLAAALPGQLETLLTTS